MQNKLYMVLAVILALLPVQACARVTPFDVTQFNVASKVLEHHPDKIGKGAKTDVKTKESSSTVTLTPGKISIRSGNNERIYDFSEDTLTYVDHAKNEFIKTSLYAIPAFKDYERKNREMLAEVTLKAGSKILQTDPFEMETIFGDDPRTEAAQKVREREENGSYKFIYNGEEVLAYHLSNFSVRDPIKDTYKKYLIYEHAIHPVIIESLSHKKAFFSSLSYRNKQEVPFSTESSFSASDFNGLLPSTPITIPENYQRHYAPDEKLDKIIKLSMTAKEKTVDDYLSEMNALLERKQSLDASLVFHEYVTHTGGKDIDKLKGTIQRIFSESPPGSDVQEVTNAIREQPASKEQLQKAIGIIEAARSKSSTHGYILNVYLANYVDRAGETRRARDLILEALEKNPFLAGAYKDLGDKYFREFDMVNAWSSWDQMRRMNPEHPLSSIINDLEQQMRQKHPVYFQ